jgi:hypothetical protein
MNLKHGKGFGYQHDRRDDRENQFSNSCIATVWKNAKNRWAEEFCRFSSSPKGFAVIFVRLDCVVNSKIPLGSWESVKLGEGRKSELGPVAI